MLGFKGLRSGAQDITKDVNFYCFKCYAPKIKAFFFCSKDRHNTKNTEPISQNSK